MKNKNWTLRYTLINVFYFVAFATIHGFAAVFLLSRDFSNTEVGIALALANILSVIGQPIVAGIVDRSSLVTNRRVLMAAAAIMLFGSLALCFISAPKPVIFALFVLIYTVQFIAMSILIAISFEYRSAGCKHNFGLARGLGSASFAVTAAVMGPVIEKSGPTVNMYVTVAVMVLMFAVVFFFRLPEDAGVSKADTAEKEEDAPTNNFIDFVRKYPMFMLFMLGVSCVFFSHNMLNDYLIQIIRHLGGGEAELGYAQFLQAILELPVMALMVFVLRKINAKAVLVFCMMAFLVKVVVMYLATGLPGMYASQSIQFFAYSVFIPTSAYYADKLMKGGDKVKGQAYINSAITLGGVFSNIVCGPVLDKHGVPAMLMVGIAVCLVGVAISVVSMTGRKRGVKNETF
ncbi:MAG: MFS transporter [Lachnospiraceae bacterium]|nr:MFS transporter [Lachnospiraceae bacterium]